mgnify:CR=1 FL=1
MISNLNVLKKMLIIGVLTLIAFVTLGTIFLISEKNILVSEKKAKLVNIVELPYSLAESEYKAFQDGKIDEATAKQNALNSIKKLRYDGKNYIWINDDTLPHPKMIMHPIATTLDGKVLSAEKFNCATVLEFANSDKLKTDGKKNLFQSFVEVVNKGNSGYVNYMWPKPKADGTDTEELYEKLSFVKKFDKWGWVIGSGIYIDDVEAEFNNSLMKIVYFVLFIIVILGTVSYFITKDLVSKVNLLDNGLTDFFKYLNKESSTAKLISIDSNDEIGKMAKVINENIEKTQRFIAQDYELIEDVKRVVNDVKNGRLNQRITRSTQNRNLEDLKKEILKIATNTIENTGFSIDSSIIEMTEKQKNINRHWVAYYEKFVIAFSCFLMFFIGAPLGAIIRKGGLGMPIVSAVTVFIIYHFINTFGKKLAQENSIPPLLGAWLSTLVLLPLAVFLTYRAINDIGGMFNFDVITSPIQNFFKKIFSPKIKE